MVHNPLNHRRPLWRTLRHSHDEDELTPLPRTEDLLYFPESSSRSIASYLPPVPSFRRSKSMASMKQSHPTISIATTVRSFKPIRSTLSKPFTSVSPLANLPAELLRIVISHLAPPSLALHGPDSLLDLPPDRNTHFIAVNQLLCLTFVSKLWRDLAIPYLYANIWLTSASSAKALARLLLEEDIFCGSTDESRSAVISKGPLILNVRVAACALRRIVPEDIMVIIDYASNLLSFSDVSGLRRIRAGFGLSPPHQDPCTSPEALAERLASPAHNHDCATRLKALSWTSYDDGPVEPDLAPLLRGAVGTNLVHLTLSVAFASTAFDLQPLTFAPGPGSDEAIRGPSPMHLPALKSLRASIDCGIFHTLATWSMPMLNTLAVVARDYANAARALGRFLRVYGIQIDHLELGHAQDELSLVAQRRVLRKRRHAAAGLCAEEEDLDLAVLVPYLKTLVCSADAEWRWQDPDWIAPHVLLPDHPTLERIAIRGIGARVGYAPDLPHGEEWDPDSEYELLFSLSQQLDTTALISHFPSLKALQDLSGALRAFGRGAWKRDHLVSKFCTKVLKNCAANKVEFVDWEGVQVHVPVWQD